jgi:hypothetical protein
MYIVSKPFTYYIYIYIYIYIERERERERERVLIIGFLTLLCIFFFFKRRWCTKPNFNLVLYIYTINYCVCIYIAPN